ncbi:MAG: T9SS type A sorting domain-containing protein [Bacteroidetes bacterium]|nr:T9SS type A sorting domain-containing protein [Bacteroidota bacterium]
MKKIYSFFIIMIVIGLSATLYGQNYALQFSENSAGLFKNTVTTSGIDVNGNSTLSVEAWVNLNSYRIGSPVLFKENGTNCVAKFIAFYFFVDEIGKVGLGLGNGTNFNVALSNNAIGLNEWHHIAATWDGSIITIYIDGVADGSAAAGGQLYDDGLEMNIGNRWNCLRRSYDGIIDEVRIWKDVRTEAEINANIYRSLPDPASEDDLIVYYKFDAGTGTTAFDHGPNGLNGQLGGVIFPSSTSTEPAWVLSTVPFISCPEVDLGEDQLVYYGYNPYACATLTAEVTGGTPPYSYAWSNGETNQSIEVCPDEPSVYGVTVTDANDCSVSAETFVDVINVKCGWGGHKVLMCHSSFWFPNFQYTICVHQFLVPWLLYFGDQLGSCNNYKSIPLLGEVPEFNSEKEIQDFDWKMFQEYQLSNPGLIENSLIVYPNPVQTYANIEFNSHTNEFTTVEVYDLMGQKIETLFSDLMKAGQQYRVNLNASEYRSGTYLIVLRQAETVKRQKITLR